MNTSRSKPVGIVCMPLVVVGIVGVGAAMGSSPSASELVALRGLVTIASAMGIYINPAPAVDPLPNATHPAAGMVGNFLGADGISGNADDSWGPDGIMGNADDGQPNEGCSGSLIESTIQPARGFALTAGHCLTQPNPPNGTWPQGPIIADAFGRFRVSGPGGAVQSSDRVRRHPEYSTNWFQGDIGLYRFANPVGGVTPYALERTSAAAVNNVVLQVGFGDTSPAGGFPTKRESFFDINSVEATGAGSNNTFTMNAQVGPPRRHACVGDSGGPYIRNGRQVGVQSSVNSPAICDGNQTYQRAMNTTTSYLYNYIDSYTRAANFWDDLRVYQIPYVGTAPPAPPAAPPSGWTLLASDDFEPGTGPGVYARGMTGYPAPTLLPGSPPTNSFWSGTASTEHPAFVGGVIGLGPNNAYRYFNAIGRENDGTTPELYRTGASGLGVVMLTGSTPQPNGAIPDYIQKVLGNYAVSATTGAQICAYVQQRWNSLTIGADVGIRDPLAPPPGTWGGLSYATATGPDTIDDDWRWRSICFSVPPVPGAGPSDILSDIILVKLLTVPEPATVLLLMAGGLAVRGPKRRWVRGIQK